MQDITPENFSLSQNYPNPFNPTTVIEYKIPMNSNAQILIYNVAGEMVKEFKNIEPYNNKISLDASNLSSGVYFYILKTSTKMISKKMLLIK